MRPLFLALLLALTATSLLGCTSDPSEPEMEYSRGVVIEQRVDDVWRATHSVLLGFGRGSKHFNEQKHEAQAVIDDELVTVRIEEYSATQSILRVITDDIELAQTVQDAITALLPR